MRNRTDPVTEQALETRVAQLEARLEALVSAMENCPTSASGVNSEELRGAILAAVARLETPALDGNGERFNSGRTYADLREWTGVGTAGDEKCPLHRASDWDVTRAPDFFVSVQTPRADVRRLRAERGLA
jgi:hypothetical protein